MAEQENGADWAAQPRRRGMQALWRLAGWGGLATLALFAAVITGYSSASSQRQAAVDQGLGRSRALPGDLPTRGGEAEETRRLTEAVRTLTADRDQAFARIAALERSLDGITGSIKRSPAPAPSVQSPSLQSLAQPPAQPAADILPPPSPVLEQPALAATPPPATKGEAPPVQVSIAPQPPLLPSPPQRSVAQQTLVQPPPVQPSAALQPVAAEAARAAAAEAARLAAIAPNPARAPAEPPSTGLGLDIGGAINYEGLRTLWHSTRNSEPSLTDDLYPLVAVRENNKTHGIDLRLLVGPIDDMETASRLCTELSAAHHYCQPVAFEGQRLSLNEPITRPAVHHLAQPKLDPNKPDAKPVSNWLQLPK